MLLYAENKMSLSHTHTKKQSSFFYLLLPSNSSSLLTTSLHKHLVFTSTFHLSGITNHPHITKFHGYSLYFSLDYSAVADNVDHTIVLETLSSGASVASLLSSFPSHFPATPSPHLPRHSFCLLCVAFLPLDP